MFSPAMVRPQARIGRPRFWCCSVRCFAIHAAGSPATNLNDYLAQVRQDPKLEGFGISAPGSMSQFFGYVISRTSGVKLVPVPYRGAAPVMTDLVAGHVPAAIVPCRDALDRVTEALLQRETLTGADVRGLVEGAPARVAA